jgi:transposase
MKDLLEQLRRDRDAAARRAEQLQNTLNDLVQLAAKQGEELTAIRKMLRRRDAQLARAEREVRKLRRRLGLDDPDPEPDAAEVPDEPGEDEDTAPDDEAADATLDSDADEPRNSHDGQEAQARPQKRRKGGRGSPPGHLPKDEERHEVDACGACDGDDLTSRDLQTSYVYSVVSSYLRVRAIRRARVYCKACGATTTAPMPPMPCDRALYDCAFIAWLVTMKFAYLMPLDRIQKMMASQGVHIAMGTLVHLMERATKLADTVDGEHMKQLRAGKYICFDGTSLKVLIQGERKAWDGYLEVFARGETTVFQFDLTKHADELRTRLSNVAAVLVTDAESRNKAGAPGAIFAHCNAHVVRALKKARKVQPVLAAQGLEFLDALYDIEEDARNRGLTGTDLAARRADGRPILERFERWLREIAESDLPPSDPVGQVARYYLRHWEGLTRFVEDSDLPIDNNEAEREFQRHAKLRYASLFAGSEEGAHRWATLLGVVRTAQKHELDVQAYFTWLFERMGTHRKRFGMAAKDLTPAAYKAAGCPGSLDAKLRTAA